MLIVLTLITHRLCTTLAATLVQLARCAASLTVSNKALINCRPIKPSCTFSNYKKNYDAKS